MIHAAFTVWLFLLIFMGIGVYRLWTRLLRPAWVNWALLPGTVVSEMAYIFGCLITGGEIRRARLLDSPRRSDGRRRRDGEAEPTTEAEPRWRILGPIVAALLALLACGAAILVLHALTGTPVMQKFAVLGGPHLPKVLPGSWPALWEQLEMQLHLLKRMCETWGELDWLDWRVPLFVYVAACLSVRLAPARHHVRSTLAAAVVAAAVIAIAAALSGRFRHLVEDIWPLLTYVYANLLFLLAVTLILRGIVLLVRVLISPSRD